MTIVQIDPQVEIGASNFARRLTATLNNVLPEGTPTAFRTIVKPLRNGVTRIGVSPVEELGIPIFVSGREVFRLIATFECTASSVSAFLSVTNSTFKVNVKASNIPLFTLDYLRDSGSDVPSAHYNLHGDRVDMTEALKSAGNRKRGKAKQKMLSGGNVPRMGQLHFPVGGDRFRPCLEDVLEMLIVEFGADARPDALQHLATGRQDWRRMQLRAAVSDDPKSAAAELRRLGYRFLWTPKKLSERTERTRAL